MTDLVQICNIYDLYNIYCTYNTALVIDVREKSQFDKLRIINSINITKTLLDERNAIQIIQSLNINLPSISSIYIYGNNDSTHQTICNTITIQLSKKSLSNISNIYHLNDSFNSFAEKFPFLYTNIDTHMNLKYPSQIINDKLYIGDIGCATNKKILKNIGITHIVNTTENISNTFQGDSDLNIKYLQIFVDDHVNEDISIYFEEVLQFIHSAINSNDFSNINNRVMVHCRQGVSRSASFVIAYLMKYYNYSFFSAEKYVKKKRNIIKPNAGFITRLFEFQREIEKSKTVNRNSTIYKYVLWSIATVVVMISVCYHISSKL
eukprot:314245_1